MIISAYSKDQLIALVYIKSIDIIRGFPLLITFGHPDPMGLGSPPEPAR